MPKTYWIAALCAIFGTAWGDTVYVSLEKGDALAVVDGISGELKQTVKLGKRPRGLAFSPDYSRLYVASSDDNTITVLDAESLKPLSSLPTVKDPKTFALSTDGKRVFVSNDDDNQLNVVDVAGNAVIKQIPIGKEPEGVTASPDGRWIVSTSESANVAQWVDTQSLEILDRTAVDTRPRASRFTDDSQQLWVTSEAAGKLSIIDAKTRQIIKKLDFQIPEIQADQIKPVDIRIDKQRKYGYVALGRANRVAVIDAQKLEVLGYIEVGKRVWHLEFSPDQKRLCPSLMWTSARRLRRSLLGKRLGVWRSSRKPSPQPLSIGERGFNDNAISPGQISQDTRLKTPAIVGCL